jgi:NitT/TauT family transport system substrate-binding protein
MRTKPLLASIAATSVLALLAGCGSSTSSASTSSGGAGEIGIGYFQSATIGPEVLVAGNPSLAKQIDAKIKLTPIDSGVAGLAELRGGAFPFVAGVGNPPVVGAISTDTKLKVIYGLYYDAAQLVVPSSVKSNADLAGKTIGALQGSSEDFEIRGWLKSQGLEDKAKVVGFPSEAAIAAAYKAKKIDAGYVEIAQAIDLKDNAGGRQVVTAEQIAKLGYPSINVLAVTDDFAKKSPEVVQQVVCQVMKAQSVATGPDADTYITHASKIVGAKPDEALAATKVIPFVAASDQAALLAKGGQLEKAYALTGQFLVDQGRTKTVPTSAQITSHVDGSYAAQALKDGCDQ